MQPITIVLTDGYSDWEIALLSGLGRAFFCASIIFASPQGGAFLSAAGLHIAVTVPFQAPHRGVIVVCGGPFFEQSDCALLTHQLQMAHENGCIIAGICGGTVALAQAGLLEHVQHTSNAGGYLNQHASLYRGASHYVDQPYALRDGAIIMAPAPASASCAVEVLVAAGVERATASMIQQLLVKEHIREQ